MYILGYRLPQVDVLNSKNSKVQSSTFQSKQCYITFTSPLCWNSLEWKCIILSFWWDQPKPKLSDSIIARFLFCFCFHFALPNCIHSFCDMLLSPVKALSGFHCDMYVKTVTIPSCDIFRPDPILAPIHPVSRALSQPILLPVIFSNYSLYQDYKTLQFYLSVLKHRALVPWCFCAPLHPSQKKNPLPMNNL